MKTYQQYLDAAGGNHEAASKAMHADLAHTNSQLEAETGNSIRARKLLTTLTPMLEELGLELPPANQRPTDGQLDALSRAADEVLEQVQTAGDGNPEAEGLLALLEEMTERLGIDLSSLDSITTDGKTDAQVEAAYVAALDAVLNPVASQLQEVPKLRASEARTKAAAALGVPAASLEEWLGERVPTLGKRKDKDGVEQDVYGLGEGEGFKPLADFATLTALKGPAVTASRLTAFTGPGARAQTATPETNPIQARLNARKPADGQQQSVSVFDRPATTQGA